MVLVSAAVATLAPRGRAGAPIVAAPHAILQVLDPVKFRKDRNSSTDACINKTV